MWLSSGMFLLLLSRRTHVRRALGFSTARIALSLHVATDRRGDLRRRRQVYGKLERMIEMRQLPWPDTRVRMSEEILLLLNTV